MTASTNPIESQGSPLDEGTPFRVDYLAHGLRIRIACGLPDLIDLARQELPPGEFESPRDDLDVDRHYWIISADESSAGFFLYIDGERSGPFQSPATIVERLESSIQIYVAEFAQPHLFLHAGVVQWLGMTIVLPGSSFAGKSTLTRALVNEGARYFSDEFAVLDAEGRVRPYARKLSHRAGPLGPTGRLNLEAHTPVADESFEPPLIDVVALMRYQAEAVWEARRLVGGEAVLAMSEHMVAIRNRPAETLQMLVNVAEQAEVYRCTRPDLDSALTWFRNLAAARDSLPPPTVGHSGRE